MTTTAPHISAGLTITLHRDITEIARSEWDACACPEVEDGGRPNDPFTTWAFLQALEESGSVGPGTGWLPNHLAAREGGRIVGVAPLYLKHHSQGEYIFDFNWAHAWERAGGRYYPKLQIAVPFTPVTGRRFLTRTGDDVARAALVEAAIRITEDNGLSSLHVTFCTGDEAAAGESLGLLPRLSEQYHWNDAGYGDYEHFLTALSSRKRKALRRERRAAQAFGGSIVALTGPDLTPEHWRAMWRFYQDTGQRKWGMPYLTRSFFDLAAERLSDHILMILALRDGRPVAGALNFIGREALFGRYWGASEHHPFLHFELCYHQAIDWALAHGLQRVEAGAQGEHKIARGYLPVRTHSLHWIADPGFRDAVSQFLAAEAAAVEDEVEILTALGPFRRDLYEERE